MSTPPPPRRPVGEAGARRPSVLPDRTREVSPAPELDGAVSSLLDLARWAKARRHRGRLTAQEARTIELALQRRTGAFSSAVRRMLQTPARRRPGVGSSTAGSSSPLPVAHSASRAPRTTSIEADEAQRDEGSARG